MIMKNEALISDLRSFEKLHNEVVQQNFKEWSNTIDMDFETMLELFPLSNEPKKLPITLVALIDDKYCGCISLRDGPLGREKHPSAYYDDKPWISNLWVADKVRGRGLATRLIEETEHLAKALGYESLYISTFLDSSLYDRIGYDEVGSGFLKGKSLRSLKKSLTTSV